MKSDQRLSRPERHTWMTNSDLSSCVEERSRKYTLLRLIGRTMRTPIKLYIAFFISIWALIWIVYSSSLSASWHLDDYQNIVRNDKIHLSTLTPASLKDTFFAGTSDKLYRPVPMASFAINWFQHGAAVLGYHLVNVLIHCLNASFLFLIVLNLYQSPRLAGFFTDPQIRWLALLTTLFWALNPVQTQAVTYIVQRMASMATLFYLVGIYLFLKYKNTATVGPKIVLAGAISISFLLAMLSKENAAFFPAAIFLIQIIFYSTGDQRPFGMKWVAAAILMVLIAAIGVCIIIIEYGDPIAFIDMLYANRPFTASQRLLTEFRVLLFYLSLLFFPAPWRLSVCHDFDVSTSIFTPLTTLPAILAVLAILWWSIANLKKKPLIAFAGLFFFVNHSVESTILPLELVFEHRNYLPSLFLFLPLAHGILKVYQLPYFSVRHRHLLWIGVCCIAIGMLGNWTFARNLVWQSEKTLWEDEIEKNPSLARPYHNLAWGYYQPRGQYDEALALYQKALKLKSHSSFETASTQNNLGRILYLMGDYKQALHYFEKSINALPQRTIGEYQIVMALIQLERFQDAMNRVDSALNSDPWEPFYLKMKGIILTRLGNHEAAAIALQKSLSQNQHALDTRVHLSLALNRIGRSDAAISLLYDELPRRAQDALVLMALSEIERQRGNTVQSDAYLNRFIAHQGIEKSSKMLLSWRNDNLSLDIDYGYYLRKIQAMETD